MSVNLNPNSGIALAMDWNIQNATTKNSVPPQMPSAERTRARCRRPMAAGTR